MKKQLIYSLCLGCVTYSVVFTAALIVGEPFFELVFLSTVAGAVLIPPLLLFAIVPMVMLPESVDWAISMYLIGTAFISILAFAVLSVVSRFRKMFH